jgi:pimeloyl-ACP methyl ester carboxylesterase
MFLIICTGEESISGMLVHAARFAIRVTPDALGCAIAAALATRINKLPPSETEARAMGRAERLTYGDGLAAWHWGEGPVVLLAHGWGGSAAQMAPLAEHVAALGFQTVAVDLSGHGSSPGNRTRWEWLIRDSAAAAQAFGPLHAAIGHSAGGLALMAARGLHGLRAQRYVCICAPSHPFPPVRAIAQRLNPRPGVLARYQDYLAAQFQTDWQTLAGATAFAGAGAETLLVYDEKDRFVPHSEGDKLKALYPETRLIKTKDHGHTRILGAPALADVVGQFVNM